jgi:predicted glycoside hydrolase/deacetylase ChbG (UPF0249 family)
VDAREVFFTADDFGLNDAVNRAVLRAHTEGALRGASLMVGQPGAEEAVRIARETPTLQVGWHLHLCQSRPLTCRAWPWGDSPARAGWAIGLSAGARALMRRELRAQWELFGASGLACAFVNSHHHLHAHPFVYRELLQVLAGQPAGWLRLGTPRRFSNPARQPGHWFWERRRRSCRLPTSRTLWGSDRLYCMRASEVLAAMAALDNGLHEFMFHPRATENDADLQALIELRRHAL